MNTHKYIWSFKFLSLCEGEQLKAPSTNKITSRWWNEFFSLSQQRKKRYKEKKKKKPIPRNEKKKKKKKKIKKVKYKVLIAKWSICRFTYRCLVTTSLSSRPCHSPKFPVNETSPSDSWSSPSVRATGGVYKGQGRIPGGLLNHLYKAFLVKARPTINNGLSPLRSHNLKTRNTSIQQVELMLQCKGNLYYQMITY